MPKKRTFYIVLFLFSPLFPLLGQNYLFDIQKINVQDGLPDRSSYYLDEDPEGFIWLSVRGKICRYDGYAFKTYDSSFLNIGDNYSCYIASDQDNHIFYCENDRERDKNSGVINTATDTIYTLESFSKGLLKSNNIFQVYKSRQDKNTIYLNTLKGDLYKYDGAFQKIYKFPDEKKYTFACEKVEDGYWVLGQSTLWKVNFNQEIVKSYSISEPYDILLGFKSLFPEPILESRNSRNQKQYWTLENGALVPYKLPQAKGRVQIFAITEDLIYYSEDNVFYISNKGGDILYQYDEVDLAGAYFSYIDAFFDSQNILWVTCGNGVYKIITKKSLFKTYHKNYSIRGIYEEGDELYIGGYGSNIKVNLLTDKINPFFEDRATAVHFVRDLDNPDFLWMGTVFKELYKYNPKTENYIQYSSDKRGNLNLPYYNTITKKLWIGSSGGLFYFDKSSNKIKFFTNSDLNENVAVKHAYQNKEGIWIVTDYGLFLMDGHSETITEHLSKKTGFPSNNLLYLYEDKDGVFWIGTKDIGLIKWNRAEDTFQLFNNQNGLSSNTIYAVFEDDYNHLWLPSNYGLMSFDKSSFNTRVYLPQDGIPHEEFNTFSYCKGKDGVFYFGGLNGVVSFKPKDLHAETLQEFPINVTSIKLLSKDSDDFKDTTKNYLESERIELSPSDIRLEVQVSLMDFTNPETNQYTYQIDGLHEQWLYADKNNIVLPKLPYGNYTLNIRGKGASGNWSKDILKIPLKVNAPFYLKGPFILITSLALLGLVLVYVRLRTQKLEKDRSQLEMEVKKRTEQIEKDKQVIASQAEALTELDKVKTQFFSNITHEFRTPLTLIIGPLEQLINEEPPPNILKRRMQGVIKNAKHIRELINQLLDLTKLENGQMQIKYVKTDIVELTSDIVKRFEVLADKKKQSLFFASNEKHWETIFDSGKWQKILYNLISNAIKFTPHGKTIRVSLYKITQGAQESISLQVKDEGIGIDKENLDRIFERFYQVDLSSTREQQGTGIGLALVNELVMLQQGKISIDSEPNQGTTFKIDIPIPLESEVVLIENLGLNTLDLPDVQIDSKLNNIGLGETVGKSDEKLELLIVEDNNDMREYIRQCLKNSNYNITEAVNGEDGFLKAQSIIPDLIVSDVMMPKKDGFTLVQEIRKTVSTSHIPFILLTAKSSLGSKLKGLKHGADVYLTKPFSPEELVLRIQKLIEIRKLLQKRYTNGSIESNNSLFQKEDEFIAKLKVYIFDNMNNPELSGETVASAFAMSRVHLYRKLKALTNQSITEYIKTIRLQEAYKLLQKKQLNISEIAYQTGFTSVSHFSRSFKQVYGKSPSKM